MMADVSALVDDELDAAPLADRRRLTDWPKEPTLLDLKADFDLAKSPHDDHSHNIKRWEQLRKGRNPGAKQKKNTNRSSVEPKLIRRQNEWRYAALSEPFLSSDKIAKVTPRTFEDEESSRRNEIVLNWQWDTKIDKQKFIDEYVRTDVDEGSVIVKLGWHRKTEMRPKEVPVWAYYPIQTEEELQVLEEASTLKSMNPKEFLTTPPEIQEAVNYSEESGQPVVAVQTGTQMIEEEIILENHPTLETVHPDNIYIDPSCGGNYKKAGFIINSFETSKAALIEDGRYKNLDKVQWSTNSVLATPDHTSQTPLDYYTKDDLRRKVVAYEYWGLWDIDGSDKLVPILATWIGDVLIRLELNPFPDEKPPFVIVTYMPIKREVMGEPDAELLEDNQKILGAVTRGIIDLMGRSANAQQGFAKGFLDVTNRRRFENGQDYEFNPGLDPRMGVFQHTYPEIPNSALTVLQMQNQDAEAMTGVKSFTGGMSGEAYGDVAAGIRGVLDASAKREMNILRRLADGIKEICKKMIAMNQVFLSEKEIIRITNMDQKVQFVTINREELIGNFDLKVDIATAEMDEKKAADLGFMLQTMGPNLDFEMVKIILAEIAELKRMPHLAHQIRNFVAPVDPMVEEMKKLELEKVRAEVAKLQADAALAEAKAKEAQTNSQAKMVEVQEEVSGVNHNRKMAEMRAQSEGNINAQITKSIVEPRKPEQKAPDVEGAVGFKELAKLMDGQSRVPALA